MFLFIVFNAKVYFNDPANIYLHLYRILCSIYFVHIDKLVNISFLL